MTKREQLLSALERYAAKKNTLSESNVLMSLMKNITWVKGDKGDRGPIGPEGPQGPRGEKGEKGDRGNDAPPIPLEKLIGEMAKDDRFKGKDGMDGTANMDEVMECAEHEIEEHEKEYDHNLLHDSKKLGKLELDESTIEEGKIFQVRNGKIVCIELPNMQKYVNSYVTQQGVSNVRSFSVTASRELDYMGMYVVDASAGNITITVPSAAGRENHWFEIIRIDSSQNTVTVVPTGSETLSGETSYLLQQWTDLRIFAHNNSYLIRSAG